MLITFKSPAGGNVLMFEDNGKELLTAMGKDPEEPRGVVTVEQLGAAIASLNAAIATQKAHPDPKADEPNQADEEPGGRVGFLQRALPLRELLERSLQEEVPLTWGV